MGSSHNLIDRDSGKPINYNKLNFKQELPKTLLNDFKPEIKTKEQIREHLGTKEQSVISHFERWWDKYYEPLSEIDKQVKQSDEVMRSHLKELGYE